MANLWAGVGRATITPPVGVDLMGVARRSGPSTGVHLPLYATSLILGSDDTTIALIDCDLLAIPTPTADELRRRVGVIIGSPAEHVLLGCTHTHSAPITSTRMTKIGGDQTGLREAELAYVVYLGYQIESAARQAMASRVPARFAAGVGQHSLTVNRREQLEDGVVVIGRNVNGPRDPDLGVLRVDSATGKPLAAVINFTSHPAIGPACHLLSSDIAGAARQTVEDLTGATALYFTGAAANVMLLKALDPDPKVAEGIGHHIGCAAATIYLGLNPQPTETRWYFVHSVSRPKVYEDIPVDRPAISQFRVASQTLDLALSPLPSLAEAEAILANRVSLYQQWQAQGASVDDLNPLVYQQLWARRLIEWLRTGTAPQSVKAEIQALRLDDLALVAVPGEPFVEIALAIKAASPWRPTFFIGYANGTVGYIPMRADYALGGYEVVDAHKGYGFPAALAPGSAERIIETSLDLLNQIAL